MKEKLINLDRHLSNEATNKASNTAARGVFWIIDGELLAFSFDERAPSGVSKSGDTYNHRLLWETIRPKGCNKAYNYYPRGRVELSSGGRAIIYMNPNIDNSFVQQIQEAFGLRGNTKIKYDFSAHYRCYIDNDWKME